MRHGWMRSFAALLLALMLTVATPTFGALAEAFDEDDGVEPPVAEVGMFELTGEAAEDGYPSDAPELPDAIIGEDAPEAQPQDDEEAVEAGLEEESGGAPAEDASHNGFFQSVYTIAVGQTLSLPMPVSGTQYKSANARIASVGLRTGVVKGVKKGTVTLAARVPGFGDYTFKVTVKKAPTKIVLTPSKLDMEVGESVQLRGKLSPSNAATALTYGSSDPSVATVDPNGVVMAAGPGKAVVQVRTHNGKKAKCTVVVKSTAYELTLEPSELNLSVKASATLRWSVVPAGTAVAFKSSKSSVATVSARGVVKAKAAGRAVITAKTVNGLTASCTVTVWKAPSKVALDRKSATLEVGETTTLSAAVPSGANPEIRWSSSNTSVASVDGGRVTALREGAAVITAMTVNGKKAQCKVTVEASEYSGWGDDDDDDEGAEEEDDEIPQRVDKSAIVDISAYDGNIDFDRLAANVSLVIARVSCGANLDSRFGAYASAMRSKGIPFGVYCYSKAATLSEARQEARKFYQYARGSGARFYVLDAEYKTLSQEILVAFAEEMRSLGVGKLGCYIAHNYYKTFGFSEIRSLFDFVWIPRYGKNDGTLENATQPSYACDLWQYTDKGSIPGISGNVDLNIITGQGKPLSYFTR